MATPTAPSAPARSLLEVVFPLAGVLLIVLLLVAGLGPSRPDPGFEIQEKATNLKPKSPPPDAKVFTAVFPPFLPAPSFPAVDSFATGTESTFFYAPARPVPAARAYARALAATGLAVAPPAPSPSGITIEASSPMVSVSIRALALAAPTGKGASQTRPGPTDPRPAKPLAITFTTTPTPVPDPNDG